MAKVNSFLKDLWRLTKPYWFSDEKVQARALLALIIAINLGLVYLEVQFNQWNNGFYNSLQNKDLPEFYRLLWQFTGLAAWMGHPRHRSCDCRGRLLLVFHFTEARRGPGSGGRQARRQEGRREPVHRRRRGHGNRGRADLTIQRAVRVERRRDACLDVVRHERPFSAVPAA